MTRNLLQNSEDVASWLRKTLSDMTGKKFTGVGTILRVPKNTRVPNLRFSFDRIFIPFDAHKEDYLEAL
jgi:hypothetical protein